MDILRSLLGMACLLAIAYLLSNNRRGVSLRTLLAALATQLVLGALVLFVPTGRAALAMAANGVNQVLEMGNHGIAFVFGGLVGNKMFDLFGDGGFVFGLRVLPMIIFVTSLIAVLYYIGVMKWIVRIFGALLSKLLGVSRIEGCSAVATIFLGQSEMPALVKPFVRQMTSAEIFTVMASGMASIAGSVLVGYAGLGVKMEYLLAASVMAVPGGLLFGKLLYPTDEPSRVVIEGLDFDEKRAANVIEAAASGASVGMRIAMNVGAMLIAFVGLIALMNAIVSGIATLVGFPHLTLLGILGVVFAPLAWLIGVPWHDAALAGNFIGEKLIFNEFVAYGDLSPYLKDSTKVMAAGLQVLDPKTIAIVSFALCGFANFSSIAILAGGFSAVAPERRSEVARHGLRALTAATLSNLMSAAIAGLFFSLH
ncbi:MULTISPECIES: NupC/NupG family nucleoside CNT transporter [Burkholderia]|uniref:Nucleoside permease n=1 Tax=Burkholderia gladioli TaxID=28095 RepID=A0A2A7SGX8_BURGA|nr:MULTISPECIES: NupC/NupG family nucleoside CNT transporter [Burkholderia]NIF87841.1 NupC/NupG family nucleoside CNT transporter [Burkholderia sp. Cy-637]ATF87998.1 NupC/NupG family nucleoside CNT transporter [Burkholderia gladioli pv. gladioli]MBJ9664640.1 NupC/NupG family nucleoside CNT transporter [Burkholderia gladioli]MBJ9713674.1 NupC/NupG family nucleoside CNT transporter [Burkholderia gladioli]MBU9193925.1 NupC/NupG family nucleoside CNT transporter [Burkholderia gladioli]